jgi:hypothetical protein
MAADGGPDYQHVVSASPYPVSAWCRSMTGWQNSLEILKVSLAGAANPANL